MLIKCKTKGPRVKGVVFHPRLQLLLASLHSGEIQMWDYLNSTLVEVFTEHDGPVRGIDFHLEQPIFASGGDDTTVIVWDFAQRKKMFTLSGHIDYVRTVQFHTKFPWLMSSSDDQTIRIWNWQSRSCISVISGHNHYVMSALFHPTENKIISASLDHTARVWDISYLVEKKCSIKAKNQLMQNNYGLESNPTTFEIEVAGVSDVICLHTMTGHTTGVNYAIFFGTNQAITAGDDCTIRIWRFTDFSFYQTNILREHEDNVTCLLLVKDYLLSTSEDHSIRIWDLNTYALIHTYVMDEDRFWTISKSRHNNYITAGHDSGLIVFKLYKERPLFTLGTNKEKNIVYYAWNNSIYLNNLENECNSFFKELLTSSNNGGPTGSSRQKDTDLNILYYKWLENNTNHNMVSNTEDSDNKLFFQCPSGSYLNQRKHIATVTEERKIVKPTKLLVNPYTKDRIVLMVLYNNGKTNYMELFSYHRGHLEYSFKRLCNSAAFVNENQLLVVENSLLLYNMRGDLITEVNLSSQTQTGTEQNPQLKNHKLTPGGGKEKDVNDLTVYNVNHNLVLIFNAKNQTMYLYDPSTRATVNVVNAPYGTLFEVTVNEYGFVCCLFKNFVVIFDRNLNRLTYKQQFNRIKSGIWHNNTSVLYSTYNQIHYLLINGSFGVLCTMVSPTYLIKVTDALDNKQVLYLANRQHRCFKHLVDSPDYSLKKSLLLKDNETAYNLINSGQLFGRFTCSYLINNHKYELARKLLKNDNVNKFYLSIQFGNLQNALNDAKLINNKEVWNYLGDVALDLGNVTIADFAYQKSKQYNKLTLLYLVTGDFGKLRKMLNMCKIHNNKSMTLLHALYLGDMEELSWVLSDSGHEHLSDICNVTYKINTSKNEVNYYEEGEPKYLMPPKPINRLEGEMLNWNIKFVEQSEFKFDVKDLEDKTKEKRRDKGEELSRSESLDTEKQFANMELKTKLEEKKEQKRYTPRKVEEEDPFSEILQDTEEMKEEQYHEASDEFQEDIWDTIQTQDGLTNEERLFQYLKNKDFTSALNFMNKLYGEVNVTLLKTTIQQFDLTKFTTLKQVNPNQINQKLNTVLDYFENAEFESCLSLLNEVLRELFLYKALNVNVARVLECCYWYMLAINLETERDLKSEKETKRSLELGAYLTCCKLETRHQYLVLRKTVGVMWKAKNYQTAASLVNRLLQLDTTQFEVDKAEMDKAKKIHTICLQKGTNQYELDLQEEDFTNLQICTVSLTKLGSEPTATCLFCGSYAHRKYVTQLCRQCQLLKLV